MTQFVCKSISFQCKSKIVEKMMKFFHDGLREEFNIVMKIFQS